jgi:phosphoenolpyruvate synthase/pyruvate phosphate dikinase
MNLVFSKDNPKTNSQFGGKANQLLRVKHLKVNVPPFLVIPANLLQNFLPNSLDISVNELKVYIEQFVFSDEFLTPIYDFTSKFSFVAVRSSALNEDGMENSFAGQYESELFVNNINLVKAIKSVWLSAFSDRIQVYQSNNETTFTGIAIIIQAMISSEVSGVAFGINPLNGNSNQKIINAVYGLGEGLVSGEIDSDLYIIENNQIETNIADKKWEIVLDKDHSTGTLKINLAIEKSQSSSLSENQVNEIHNLLKTLESFYKAPQDIEFAFFKNQLFLLQTRPITAVSKEKTIVWDNSNIIESYPGITSTLTYSFIEKMYEAVYRQMSLIMGISAKTVEENSSVYANMLGHLCGRVYYNLNNWHKSLSLLPGYQINADLMDNMMGVKEKFETEKTQSKGKVSEYWNVTRAIFKILRRHALANKDRLKFQEYFNSVMEEYNGMNFKEMDLSTLQNNYFRFEETLVKKWQAPLVNDFFCMIYFGVLQKLVKKYQLDENGTLHNDLVSGAKDIISTEPISLTLEIAREINKNSIAIELFLNEYPEFVLKEIESNPVFSVINTMVKSYIQKWGERCVGELKLETITYKQAPENYIRILQSYVRNKQFEGFENDIDIRREAEKRIKYKLKRKVVKKLIFFYVLRKARYFVSNRENLRFERTRGFGMVRMMMVEMGEKLFYSKSIEHPRDIFYLNQKEVFSFIKNKELNLKEIIQKRKIEEERFEKIQLPERIKTSEKTKDFSVFEENTKEIISVETLQGVGCCAGIIRATVSVIHSPYEIESLNNTILVTASTDPGWVVLFPSAAAIVVERGSLLSHSAIVSREMGIPCIVGVKNLLSQLKTGDLIEMDGTNGSVKILKRE